MIAEQGPLETFLQYLQRINNVNPSLTELIARNYDYQAIINYLTEHLIHDNQHINWIARNIAELVFKRAQYLNYAESSRQLYYNGTDKPAYGNFLSPAVTKELNDYDNVLRDYIEQLKFASQFYPILRNIALGGKRKTNKRNKKRRHTRRK